LGGHGEQAVIEALKGKPSLEERFRLQRIFKAYESVPELDTIGTLRAIHVLEQIGSPAVWSVLEDLARGAPAVQETHAAWAALVRLASRPSCP
jgi:hypothetical protein